MKFINLKLYIPFVCSLYDGNFLMSRMFYVPFVCSLYIGNQVMMSIDIR